MTKIKCDFRHEFDTGSYCQHRKEDGFCSLPFIQIKTGGEGYAMYEACCDHVYDGWDWYNKEYSEFFPKGESR